MCRPNHPACQSVTGNTPEILEEAETCCGKPTARCHQWSPAEIHRAARKTKI